MPADNIVESRHSTSPSARPQEFDVGLAVTNYILHGAPQFPGLSATREQGSVLKTVPIGRSHMKESPGTVIMVEAIQNSLAYSSYSDRF